jgi:LysM repeat protein
LKSITILKVKIITHFISSGGDGAEAIYALRDRDTLARIILEEIAKTGQNIRKWYQRRLPDDTSKDYYFIHRNTGVTEPVIVEYGFVDNAADASFIKSHWKDMAEAVVRAVALYKGVPYTGAGAQAGATYTVQSGDSLWSIAKKFNVSVTDLKAANNLTTNTLTIGQVLTIPSPTQVTPTNNTYTVQSGDSLWTIANKFGVTVTELRNLNNLTSDTLSIGQVLLIPVQPAEVPSGTTTYTVQSGDSLYSIARKFGITVTSIREANNLTSDALSIGQVLKIPQPGSTEPPISNIPTTTTYTVMKGDSLYSIASKFGTTTDAIKSLNNLTSNLLSIGQVLTIPTTGSTGTTYVVQNGDSLWTIANKFGVSVNEIRSANNLTTDLLSIGQVLVIPTTSSTGTTYVVKSGDSLWTIANKFGVSVNEIRNANNLTTDLLSIGQVLVIP